MPEKPTAPCKDCPKRVPHCHSVCERYKQYREQLDSEHEKRRAIMDEADFIRAVKRKAARINQRLQRDNERRR